MCVCVCVCVCVYVDECLLTVPEENCKNIVYYVNDINKILINIYSKFAVDCRF